MRRIVNLLFRVLCIGVIFSTPSCGKDSVEEVKSGNVISIAHLRSQYRGGSTRITDDYIIEGYVVANDYYSEWYKSIVISDGSGGVEIMLDAENLYQQFPIFSHITVRCSTLWMGEMGGSIVLGTESDGSYVVNRIDEQDIDNYISVDANSEEMSSIVRLSLSDISSADVGDIRCVEDISFGEQAGGSWCDWDATQEAYIDTQRVLYDSHGHSLPLRISGHCSYAAEKIPSGEGSIVVIVEYYDNQYSLRMTNYTFNMR